eukprot:Rhum_TRINITY_DN14154_c24_g1::Rhum_TRINITY_DN14154_c24_g1_i1::g.71112::m.71112
MLPTFPGHSDGSHRHPSGSDASSDAHKRDTWRRELDELAGILSEREAVLCSREQAVARREDAAAEVEVQVEGYRRQAVAEEGRRLRQIEEAETLLREKERAAAATASDAASTEVARLRSSLCERDAEVAQLTRELRMCQTLLQKKRAAEEVRGSEGTKVFVVAYGECVQNFCIGEHETPANIVTTMRRFFGIPDTSPVSLLLRGGSEARERASDVAGAAQHSAVAVISFESLVHGQMYSLKVNAAGGRLCSPFPPGEGLRAQAPHAPQPAAPGTARPSAPGAGEGDARSAPHQRGVSPQRRRSGAGKEREFVVVTPDPPPPPPPSTHWANKNGARGSGSRSGARNGDAKPEAFLPNGNGTAFSKQFKSERASPAAAVVALPRRRALVVGADAGLAGCAEAASAAASALRESDVDVSLLVSPVKAGCDPATRECALSSLAKMAKDVDTTRVFWFCGKGRHEAVGGQSGEVVCTGDGKALADDELYKLLLRPTDSRTGNVPPLFIVLDVGRATVEVPYTLKCGSDASIVAQEVAGLPPMRPNVFVVTSQFLFVSPQAAADVREGGVLTRAALKVLQEDPHPTCVEFLASLRLELQEMLPPSVVPLPWLGCTSRVDLASHPFALLAQSS